MRSGDCDCYACRQSSHRETLRLVGIDRMLRTAHKRKKTGWYCPLCRARFEEKREFRAHIRECVLEARDRGT